MIELTPHDRKRLAFELSWAVRNSGMTLNEICEQLEARYAVKLTYSGLSHLISRGSINLDRALMILSICGITEIQIRDRSQPKN